MTVEVIGVRHFSPACARWAERRIAEIRPRFVLIEGPSDFNARIDELRLPHRLPLAIYSYFVGPLGTQHCFSPFVEFAPEWVALAAAAACGAQARFIDLPFASPAWHDKRVRYDVYARHGRERYRRILAGLCDQFGMDGDDGLWDHLFERTPHGEDLGARLSTYFDALRGDDTGEPEDAAREDFMSRYVAWAAAQGGDVVVVCGGWHKRAIERAWPSLVVDTEPVAEFAPDIERRGNFLVPYSDRRLDAFGGYGAGMPSPQYYRWIWEAGNAHAARAATATVVRRLRERKQPLSTAALIAARYKCDALARMRGHPEPLRSDVLDGLTDAVLDGALDAPLPWAQRGVLRPTVPPQVREMLLALTGERTGVLAPGTPLPPLLRDVERLLVEHQLRPGIDAAERRLDRRNADESAAARVLWRLKILRIAAFALEGVQAQGAARSLAADQRHTEVWRLRASDATTAELIQASAYGPDLESAALRCLEERLAGVDDPAALADGVVEAIRAGYGAIGGDMLARLSSAIAQAHEHGKLASAGLRLQSLADQGFWGEELAASLTPLLDACLDRLLWLVEGLVGPTAPASKADIESIAFIERRTHADPPAPIELRDAALALLRRRARDADAPPALRGACFGALWKHGAETDDHAIATAARSLASGSALGDFLSGLFALAREELAKSDELVRALDAAICGSTDDDFLVALPALRQAFAWFPPRERGELAFVVAKLHGKGQAAADAMTRLPVGAEQLVRARELEERTLAWARRYGLFEVDTP